MRFQITDKSGAISASCRADINIPPARRIRSGEPKSNARPDSVALPLMTRVNTIIILHCEVKRLNITPHTFHQFLITVRLIIKCSRLAVC